MPGNLGMYLCLVGYSPGSLDLCLRHFPPSWLQKIYQSTSQKLLNNLTLKIVSDDSCYSLTMTKDLCCSQEPSPSHAEFFWHHWISCISHHYHEPGPFCKVKRNTKYLKNLTAIFNLHMAQLMSNCKCCTQTIILYHYAAVFGAHCTLFKKLQLN